MEKLCETRNNDYNYLTYYLFLLNYMDTCKNIIDLFDYTCPKLTQHMQIFTPE